MAKRKFINWFLFAATVTFSVQSIAAGYMKIGDIKGESTEASHKDWIVIESMLEGASVRVGSETGVGRERVEIILPDLELVKSLDRSSPQLRDAIVRNQTFPNAFIEFPPTTEGEPRYRIELTNVSISSVEAAISSDKMVEALRISYEAITWKYSGPMGATEASWNLQTGTREVLPQLNRLLTPQ